MNKSILILDSAIIILSILSYFLMIKRARAFDYVMSFHKKVIFAVIGIIALFLDTIGVGSFAASMAMVKGTRTVKDEDIPAYLNLMQVLPNGLEAVLFLSVIHIEPVTFFALVISSIIGGFISAKISSKLPVQKIRGAMLAGLVLVAGLLILTQLHIMSNGGSVAGLFGIKLVIAIICFIFISFLLSVGVGNYAAMQVVLFLLGMTPLAVFPIMTTSAALQEVAIALSFLSKKQLPIKEALTAGIFGCIGVVAAFLLLKDFTPVGLHWLLFVVILFNIYMIFRSFMKDRRKFINGEIG
ncbi:MAG: hypothetical protein NTX05_02305 [Fusobacteria bacterium]|nr:hypothetical protein [Fusobacteriota bacterium]